VSIRECLCPDFTSISRDVSGVLASTEFRTNVSSSHDDSDCLSPTKEVCLVRRGLRAQVEEALILIGARGALGSGHGEREPFASSIVRDSGAKFRSSLRRREFNVGNVDSFNAMDRCEVCLARDGSRSVAQVEGVVVSILVRSVDVTPIRVSEEDVDEDSATRDVEDGVEAFVGGARGRQLGVFERETAIVRRVEDDIDEGRGFEVVRLGDEDKPAIDERAENIRLSDGECR